MKSGLNGHLILNGTDSEMSSSAFSMFTSIDSTEPLFIGGIPSESTMVMSYNLTISFIRHRGYSTQRDVHTIQWLYKKLDAVSQWSDCASFYQPLS